MLIFFGVIMVQIYHNSRLGYVISICDLMHLISGALIGDADNGYFNTEISSQITVKYHMFLDQHLCLSLQFMPSLGLESG